MGMMTRRAPARALLVGGLALLLGACATAAPTPAPPAPGAASTPGPRPAAYESEDFVVTFAQPGETPATLAARYLGSADRAWMIEDYSGQQAFSPGQEVVIPRRPWNQSGVTPGGYQIVPILTYHNLAEQAKGRLVLAAASFREQMQYLKTNGYRVVSLADFVEFTRLGRQLPQRAVVLTFDDGYRSFKDYAYPVLKELGFTATLFIYTDWVGAGLALLERPAGADRGRLRHRGPHQDPRRPAPRPGRDRGPVRAADACRARAAPGPVQQEPGAAQPDPGLSLRALGGGPPAQGQGVRLHRRVLGAPPGQCLVRAAARRAPQPDLLRDDARRLR